MIHQRHTDGRTTCDSKTALCTVVQCAVKTDTVIAIGLLRTSLGGVVLLLASVLKRAYCYVNGMPQRMFCLQMKPDAERP